MKTVTEDMQTRKTGRFYLLDLLRFFAAVSVVFYHYSIFFESSDFFGFIKLTYYGYLGVPFFFILSGFVIAASAMNRSPLKFALSRAARLYPAFWGGLLFSVCINFAFGDSFFTLKEILLNATILNDYLGVRNIDGVFWTLQAELKFYGCVFLLLTFKVFKSFTYWLLAWLFLAIFHYFTSEPASMGMFINPSYSFYFIGGICCYLLYLRKWEPKLLLILGVSAIFSMLTAFDQVKDFYPSANNYDHVVVVLIIFCFYLFFFLLALGKMDIRPFYGVTLLGSISYPLYLIHNFAGKLIINKLLLLTSSTLAVSITLTIVLCVSIFIHLVIERNLTPLMYKVGNRFIALFEKTQKVKLTN